MDIRNLSTFLKIAELQSFSRAAEELDYSQSAVTIQIQQLERELGVSLFDRIGKRIALTQYGQDFIPYARDAVAATNRAANFAARNEELSGTVTIGFEDTLLRAVLPDLIPTFHRRFPNVLVRTMVGTNRQLKKALLQNQVDLIYTLDSPIDEPQFHSFFRLREDISVIANVDHPLSSRARVCLADLIGHPFILMQRNNPYRDMFDRALADQNLSIQPFLELESDVISLRLVGQNPEYLTILPRFTLQRSILAPHLTAIRLEDCQLFQWRQILSHKSKVITPQLQGILDILTEHTVITPLR